MFLSHLQFFTLSLWLITGPVNPSSSGPAVRSNFQWNLPPRLRFTPTPRASHPSSDLITPSRYSPSSMRGGMPTDQQNWAIDLWSVSDFPSNYNSLKDSPFLLNELSLWKISDAILFLSVLELVSFFSGKNVYTKRINAGRKLDNALKSL